MRILPSLKCLLLPALLLPGLGLPLRAAENAAPPNVVFILADDLGYGELGCYGQQTIQTPSLDRLAEEGLRFTRHYAGAAVCGPSRCSLLTGLHTGHSRIRGNGTHALKDGDLTIAEVFKSKGYATAMIGKWDSGTAGTSGDPSRQGFDEVFGYLHQVAAHNHFPDRLWKNGEQVPVPNEVVYREVNYSDIPGSVATKRAAYAQDLFTEAALEFIGDNAKRPFFLYLSYIIPHANNEHWIGDSHGMEVPDNKPYEDRPWPDVEKATAAMITRLDRDVGKIRAKLDELGLDNTIVIFTSDNGPHEEGMRNPEFFDSNGDLRGLKRDFYEGGLRVPLVVQWTGRIAPGTISEHLSANYDFLATFCDLTGAPAPDDTDGISLLPTLLGREQRKHPFLYWESRETIGRQAVLAGDWKLVRLRMNGLPDGVFELYNLVADPGELGNLYFDMPEKAAELRKLMEAAHVPSPEFPIGRENKNHHYR